MLRGETEPKYGLRKLSIGLVSAMIGMTTFMVVNGHADDSSAKADNVAGTAVANDNSVVRPYSVDNGVASSAADVESAASSAAGWNNSGVKSDDMTARPVNSQVPAASSVSINSNETTFNARAHSVARVAAFNDSKVSINANSADSVASNVNVKYSYYGDQTRNPGILYTIDAQYDFDLDVDHVPLNQPIVLGHWQQLSDTGRNMSFTLTQWNAPVQYNNRQIGTLTYDGSDRWPNTNSANLILTLTSKPDVVGKIHLSAKYPGQAYFNINEAKNFRGVVESHNTVKFINNDGQETTSLDFDIKQPTYQHYSDKDLSQVQQMIYNESSGQNYHFSRVDSGGGVAIAVDTGWADLDPNSVAQHLHDNDLTTPVAKRERTYLSAGHLFVNSGNGTFLPRDDSQLGFTGDGVGVDSQGHFLIAHNPTDPYSQTKFDVIGHYRGLSLADLKAKLDQNKNSLLISQQGDGSLIYILNLLPSFFTVNPSDDDLKNDANKYFTVNADGDPDKAADNTANAIKNVFGNHQSINSIWLWSDLADPLNKVQLQVDQLDPNTGAVIQTQTQDFIPNSYMSKGQSAVKLHVIDSKTGLDVEQVQTHIDWPNQGKKADLMVTVPTNYQIETDFNKAQSVLNQFNLSGNVLTGNASVDFPGVNTIVNYYVVVNPVAQDHTVTYQFVDSDEDNKNVGLPMTVTGKTGASSPVSLTIPKYFDLADNQILPTSVTIGSSDSTVLIYLKHHIDSQTRHYRVIENLPDGTQKVIIELNATIYKDAATDKWIAEGAFADGDCSKSLLKRNDYQVISGIYDPNSPFDDFLHADVDRIAGYKPVMIDGFNGEYRDLVMSNFNADQYLAYFDLFYSAVGLSDHDDWTEGSNVLPSRDFHINYVPIDNQATVTIRYRDIVTGKIINTTAQQIIGKHEITYQAPNGYKIVDVDKLPVTVTANKNGSVSAIDANGNVVTDPDIIVTIDADTNLKDPTIARDPVHFNNDLSFDHAQQDKITRIVHFVSDNGQTLSPDLVQTIGWNSSIKNGQVVDGDTNVSKNFGEFTVPTIDGYTVDGIEGVNHDEWVSHNQPFNEVITIYYHKSDVPLHGSTTITVPVIGDNEKIPINPGDPRYKDTQRTIERTLLAKNPITGDIVHVKNQMYTFTRDEYWNPITKTVYYGNWSDNGVYGFPELTGDVPVFAGYKANIPDGIGLVSAGPDYGHQTFTVTYTGNIQRAYVQYVDADENDKVLSTETFTGITDSHYDYSTASKNAYFEARGYRVDSDPLVDHGFDFDNNDQDDQYFTVVLGHDYVDITSDTDKQPGSPINPGVVDSPRYPDAIASDRLMHIVKEVVYYQYADGSEAWPFNSMDTMFGSTVMIDKVTGKIVSISWPPASQTGEIDSPFIYGFHPDKDKILPYTVNHVSPDKEFTVTYYGNPQTAYVKYIDDGDHGKVLSTVKLTGVSRQEINYSPTATINKYLSEGYFLSSNDMAQGPFYFDITDDSDQNFEIHFNHGTVDVTPGNPQNPGSLINPGDPNGPKYPKGVAKNDLIHVVHRTVHYVFTNGKTPLDNINQDLVYNETLTIDKVTGHIIRTLWTDNQDFDVAVSPIVQGYTPDRQQVVDNNIAHDHADIIETVTYSPDAQTAVVTYIDDTTGKTLLTKTITGVSDQDSGYSAHDQIQSYINRGYQVVADGTNGGNVIFDHIDNVNQQIEVHLAHTYEPAHQDDQVIRHIIVEDPHNGDSTITQTVDVHRDGTRDRVTDYIDWKPWTKGEIPEFKVPIVPGYKPNYSDVPAEPTNDNKVPADDNLKITYHALPQQLIINYITMDGQQVGSQKLDGVTDEVINVKSKAPVGYQLIAGTVPATYTLSYEDNELDIMVAVARNFRSYKTGDSDLVRTVTRLINIVRPDYTNGTVLQQVTLVRNAWMDERGNTLSYTDWIPLNTNSFSSYVPPVIDGYIAQVAKEAKVDANTPNQQFVVLRYNEVDPASQHPMYIDAQGQTYDELPIGYQIVAGQNANSGSMLIVPVNSHSLVPELKYYTRTVTITMPNGKQRVIRQRVAAGKAFNQVHLPKLRGFKAVITGNVDRAAANGDLIASVEFVKI